MLLSVRLITETHSSFLAKVPIQPRLYYLEFLLAFDNTHADHTNTSYF